jgi:hypothetical protein
MRLFEQVYVDKAVLMSRIREELSGKELVSLQHILKKYPLEKGLAELVAYISLACGDRSAVIDEEKSDDVGWISESGVVRRAVIPLIIFNRRMYDR